MNRSHSINHELKEIYVLPHLYGELARHRFGINLINEQGLLSDAVKTVLAGNTETMFDVSQLKAALWALGHIGSTVAGKYSLATPKRKASLLLTFSHYGKP